METKRSTIQDLLITKPFGQEVVVYGWIKSLRRQARVAFVHLYDGSTPSFLQLVMLPKIHESIPHILEAGLKDAGLVVRGEVCAPKGGKSAEDGGQDVELFVKEVLFYGHRPEEEERPYPVAVDTVPPESLRTLPHMRPRTTLGQTMAFARHKAMMETHTFFDGRGFKWIGTPIISGSDCEGAGEQFSLMDDPTKPFFGGDRAHLTVSGQVDLEPFIAAGSVYTFGPTFRAEHSKTKRHLSEFWMVEPEMLGTMAEVMDLAEAYVKHLLTIPSKYPGHGLTPLHYDLETPFVRITYTEAVRLLQEETVDDPSFFLSWGDDLSSDMEMLLTSHFKSPVFVTHYPRALKAFYMRQTRTKEAPDRQTVEAFDLLMPGIGEIIGGSAREEDETRLIAAMVAKGMDLKPYQAYLDMRHWGTLPHGGFGLGFERIVSVLTGDSHLREITPYVRAYGASL